MDMNYIPTNLKINIEWTVMKGVGNEAEDFSRSAVALFLFSEENRWAVPCVADYTGVVKAQLPETLAEGVYSLDLIWVKNDGSVKGSRCIQRTRKPCVFVVDAGTQPPAGYEGQPVTVEISTVAAPYGYDGLSAYEIAVLRDATTLDEQEWSKGLFNDVLANELKRNQEEIKETQEDISKAHEDISKAHEDIETLYRGTQDLPEIRKNLSKAQEDIENGKKEVKSLRKTVESLAASGGSGGGGGASVASAVYFDNENTTLYGANVQDAVEELSSKVDSAVSNVIPTTNDNGDCVLGVETFGHGEDPEYKELPIPEATANNAGVMPKEDKKKLDSIIPSGLIVSNNGGAALNICDTKGNVIVRFSGGHIRTKFFDSRNYSTDTTPDDMSIKGTSIIVKDADFTGFDIGEGPVIPPGDTPIIPPSILEQFAYNFPFTVGG